VDFIWLDGSIPIKWFSFEKILFKKLTIWTSG
jgi:hypothetical protein